VLGVCGTVLPASYPQCPPFSAACMLNTTCVASLWLVKQCICHGFVGPFLFCSVLPLLGILTQTRYAAPARPPRWPALQRLWLSTVRPSSSTRARLAATARPRLCACSLCAALTQHRCVRSQECGVLTTCGAHVLNQALIALNRAFLARMRSFLPFLTSSPACRARRSSSARTAVSTTLCGPARLAARLVWCTVARAA
jgi:hypothetical protein